MIKLNFPTKGIEKLSDNLKNNSHILLIWSVSSYGRKK